MSFETLLAEADVGGALRCWPPMRRWRMTVTRIWVLEGRFAPPFDHAQLVTRAAERLNGKAVLAIAVPVGAASHRYRDPRGVQAEGDESDMRAFFLLLSMLLAACTSPPPSPSRDDSLYRGLGEHQGITRVVEDALLNASRNPRLVLRMAEIDADSLRLKLIEQICVASGGPCVATGGASLSATEFDALLDDLSDAMAGQGVAMSVQRRLLARLAPARGAVMGR